MNTRNEMTAAQRLAEDMLANREWREDQNIAAGKTLTVKEMYEAAQSEANYKVEQANEAV